MRLFEDLPEPSEADLADMDPESEWGDEDDEAFDEWSEDESWV